jgi:hypothetical protein
MNSIDLQELRLRQMQLTVPYLEPLDMYKNRSLRLDTQNSLLPSSQGSSILGRALWLVSPHSLLPTMAPGQSALIALLNNHQLLASQAQSRTNSALQQKMELLSNLLGGHLGASLPKSQTIIPGRVEPFPEKLHRLLVEVEALGRPDIISFIEDDTFLIHDQVRNQYLPLGLLDYRCTPCMS